MNVPATDNLDTLLDSLRKAAGEWLTALPDRPAVSAALTLADRLAEHGIGAVAAVQCFRERYEAQLSGSAGPRYWAFVTGGCTPAALAGDWLSTLYDQNVSHHAGSIASAIEHETVAALRGLFGLDNGYHGWFVSGATMSNTAALAAARQHCYAKLDCDVAQDGLHGLPRIAVLAGSAHASIAKALAVLGMGRRALEAVPCFAGRTALDIAALELKLAELKGAPVIVVASAGEVNTGDFDDLAKLADLRDRYGFWLHVDGAFGLFAALSQQHAHKLAGIAAADSITVDLHKWLNVPYDSALVLTRHPELLQQSFRSAAAYLGASSDPLHYTPENSRRFRALPAWLSLAAYGRAGIAEWVTRNCQLAERFAAGLAQIPGLQLLSEVHLNIVCFALKSGGAEQRDALLRAIAADGTVCLSATQLFGRPAIRAAVVNWRTQASDVDLALSVIGKLTAELPLGSA